MTSQVHDVTSQRCDREPAPFRVREAVVAGRCPPAWHAGPTDQVVLCLMSTGRSRYTRWPGERRRWPGLTDDDMTAAGQTGSGIPVAPHWAGRPANLASALAAELVGRIVGGRHPPGTSLPPEPALCQTFSVSRTVVREAVKMLQEKGLVQVPDGVGMGDHPLPARRGPGPCARSAGQPGRHDADAPPPRGARQAVGRQRAFRPTHPPGARRTAARAERGELPPRPRGSRPPAGAMKLKWP